MELAAPPRGEHWLPPEAPVPIGLRQRAVLLMANTDGVDTGKSPLTTEAKHSWGCSVGQVLGQNP